MVRYAKLACVRLKSIVNVGRDAMYEAVFDMCAGFVQITELLSCFSGNSYVLDTCRCAFRLFFIEDFK